MKLTFDCEDFTKFAQTLTERNDVESLLAQVMEANGIVPASSTPEIDDWTMDDDTDTATIIVFHPEDWTIETETWLRDNTDEFAKWELWLTEHDRTALVTVDMSLFADVAAPLMVAA